MQIAEYITWENVSIVRNVCSNSKIYYRGKWINCQCKQQKIFQGEMYQLSVQIAEYDIAGENVSTVSANSRIYYRGKCINCSKCMFEHQNMLQWKMHQLSVQIAEIFQGEMYQLSVQIAEYDIAGENVSIVSANNI